VSARSHFTGPKEEAREKELSVIRGGQLVSPLFAVGESASLLSKNRTGL
jgi:hypothetical protein